jgi:heavy metal sensor kinase
MRRSLRGRLQAWYGLVLVAVVAGFAGLLYHQVRAARLREADAGLESAALYLEAVLRRFPPHDLGDGPPDGPGEPGGLRLPPASEPPPPPRPPGRRGGPPEGRPFPPPPPPRPSRERLLAELTLPQGPPAPEGRAPADAYFAVWRADGSLLKASPAPADVGLRDPSDLPLARRPRLVPRGEYREAVMLGPGRTRILVGRSVAREWAEVRAFAWQLAGAGAAVLAVGLAGGWVVSARVLRPVAVISATASSISAANLSGRIDAAAVDRELAGLAGVLNAMFGRLEAAFERQARFTADASHELRTPLAVIRSHAELALARPRSEAEYREALTACLRAAGRMAGLVDGLLTLARADAGKLDLTRAPVDLARLAEDTVDLLRPLAEAKGVSLSTDPAPATVTGDAGRLEQVVTNLVSNAVQYNRPGGAVLVRLRAAGGWAELAVEDTGPGIPEADRPYLFERFYRVDKARSRSAGGHGLGLAICKSVAEAHGGTVGFESECGRGSTFYVRLPCAGATGPAGSQQPAPR